MDNVPYYSVALKLSVVQEIESGKSTQSALARKYGIKGHSTILKWLRKYGNGSYGSQKRATAMSEKKKRELHLENEVKALKRELEEARVRNVVLETLIDVADEELGMDLRKKCGAKPVRKSKK